MPYIGPMQIPNVERTHIRLPRALVTDPPACRIIALLAVAKGFGQLFCLFLGPR